MTTEKFPWVDNPTESGVAECKPDVLNDCLMHLKYNHISKGVNGRNVGDIFYTSRTDNPLNGAYECDGAEFMQDDFEGVTSPYELLVLGKLPAVTYEEYAAQIAANNGCCAMFALDTEKRSFKVPTLKDAYISQSFSNSIGDFVEAGVPNISGGATNIGINTSEIYSSGCFSVSASGHWGATNSGNSKSNLYFNASASSPIYGKSSTVRPNTVRYRAMVQLSNVVDDSIAVETYTKRLEDTTNEKLASISTAVDNGLSTLNNSSTCLTQSQITNSILEIPQRLKLELKDGAAALKKGSVVIVPYGTTAPEKAIGNSLNGGTIVDISWDESKLFYYVQFNEDLSYINSAYSDMSVLYLNDLGVLESVKAANAYSGTTVPALSENSALYYDSVNNLVKKTSDKGVTWTQGMSLPTAVCNMVKDTGFTYIKNIFNGVGFIGSTVWCDKGVRALYSNGRNPDGSLNNVEYEVRNVAVNSLSSSESAMDEVIFYIDKNNSLKYYKQSNVKTVDTVSELPGNTNDTLLFYVNNENISYYSSSDTNYTWTKCFEFPIARGQVANSVIENLQGSTTFRAVDYNEFKDTPHIIETYFNDASWYRVWSDGWIEQGGKILYIPCNSTLTYSLLKKMSKLDYNVALGIIGGFSWTNNLAVQSRTTTSISFLNYRIYGSGNDSICGYWCIRGY